MLLLVKELGELLANIHTPVQPINIDVISRTANKLENGRQKRRDAYTKRDLRSPGKISNYVGIAVHRNSRCTVMTVIRSNRDEAIFGSVCQILILNTYRVMSVLER